MSNPVPGRIYTVTISHKDSLFNDEQWVSIITTGRQLTVSADSVVAEAALNAQGDLSLLWSATVGQSYQIQSGTGDALLNPSLWQIVGPVLPADREQLAATVSLSTGSTDEFFRVVRVTTQAF
ncbi:MAG: hypothetical protein HC841_04825 [Verrucomicrobiae bacterium]|nr:hypothetical protein [Verrucomicrobiae bacterium]